MSSSLVGPLVHPCKYGENAWQRPAGLHHPAEGPSNDPLALPRFQIVSGDVPSFNNWVDIERMLQTVTHIAATFDVNGMRAMAIAVGVKHGNPCGASVYVIDAGATVDIPFALEATRTTTEEMVSGDSRAIFGGLVMLTYPVDLLVAEALLHFGMKEGQKQLYDGIVAPAFGEDTIDHFKRKNDKCRLIENPALISLNASSLDREPRRRRVRGGELVQPNYTFVLDLKDPQVERFGEITLRQEKDILLAWAIGSTSNSNTITLVKDGQLIGNGVGQQDRVGAAELAIKRARDAGHRVEGAVAYSDSFFPAPDGPAVLGAAGVKAIFTSSGSLADKKVKAVCEAMGVSLVMIPDAMGRGFANH
jgi:phosphoribosylaminoimidazolecarboxamide formyltransferase / IMP cyclohydrolase